MARTELVRPLLSSQNGTPRARSPYSRTAQTTTPWSAQRIQAWPTSSRSISGSAGGRGSATMRLSPN
eukprot:1406796-Pyramimonas_sp.AAC.1